MRRLMSIALLALVAAPATASAMETHRVDLCLGESFIEPARPGHVFTYTEPKFADTWPSMVAEHKAAAAAADVWAASGDPMPVGWALSPNNELLQAPTPLSVNPKLTTKANPMLYLDGLAKGHSTAIFTGHNLGAHKVKVWQRNVETGAVSSAAFVVVVNQCGTSTLLPSTGDYTLCEGAASISVAGGALSSNDPSVIYSFVGLETGTVAYAGVRAGWATLQQGNKRKANDAVRAQVVGEGVKGCPKTTAANLEVGEGINTFGLKICKNHSWIAPAGLPIASLTTSNGNLWTEPSHAADGMLLYAMNVGKTTVVVEFEDERAQPMVLDVTIESCY
jgi:hypothetical protein